MNKRVTLMALLLSISLISRVSAVTGTYVDLTPFNTVAVDGADPWYNADGSGGLWRQRAFGNEDSIYQGQGANGSDLKTTISDLIPGQVYDIYAIYWSKDIGENWGMLPGLDPNRAYATWYNWENGAETGPIILGSIYEMEALVGTATANKEGEVGIYVFNHAHITTSQRSWVDGFSYKQAFLTYNPQPAHQAESVALDTNQLAWSTMSDPCSPTQTYSEVSEHWVYFGETPYLTVDHLLAKVPVSTEQVSSPPLEANKRYYWCADEILVDGSHILCAIWTFETIKTLPSFDSPLGSQPQDVRAIEGETIMFTAVAGTTGGPVENCQWYKGLPGDTSNPLANDPNHISGAQSNQLTIIVASADEGSYFCRADNEAGTKDSEVATLLLKRLLAWYKFDENLNDSAGTNNGTMDNPVYVDGMDGKALSFDGSNYVNLGTDSFPKTGFNNGLKTGSVSFWINSPVPAHSFTATFNDDLATGFKVDYSAGNYLSFLIRDDNGVGLSGGIAPSGSILDAWHLITCTWDTESGEAAIYLDGVSTGLVTSGQPSEFAAWQYPMLIGARQNRLTVDDFYVGLMDDYRVYNYPLDGYEVAELYTSLAGGRICVEYPVGDLNQDCVVDQIDLEILRSAWLDCGWVPAAACEYKIDLAELVPLLTAWLEELSPDEGM